MTFRLSERVLREKKQVALPHVPKLSSPRFPIIFSSHVILLQNARANSILRVHFVTEENKLKNNQVIH